MDHRLFHWLNKIQVHLATIAGMTVVYMLAWPYVRPLDGEMPLSFLAAGSMQQLSTFSMIVLALAAIMGVLMVSVRPAAAAVVILSSAGAVSLRSSSFRTLLQYRFSDLPSLYHTLMGETALLWCLALACVVVMLLMRTLVGYIRPGAIWQDPLKLKAADVAGVAMANTMLHVPYLRSLGLLHMAIGSGRTDRGAKTLSISQEIQRSIICLILAFVVAVVLLLLLMKSDARGQCIFAVLVSMFVAAFISHMAVPCRFFLGAMVLPLASAMVLYWLASNTNLTLDPHIAPGPQAWMEVRPYGTALPIDWMTLGIAASLLGYWVSSCLHENHYLESLKKHAEEEDKAQDNPDSPSAPQPPL